MSKRRKGDGMTAAEAARLIGLRHGYKDPAAVELRNRARWEARRELLGEIFTVALWLAGGYLWILLAWPEV